MPDATLGSHNQTAFYVGTWSGLRRRDVHLSNDRTSTLSGVAEAVQRDIVKIYLLARFPTVDHGNQQ